MSSPEYVGSSRPLGDRELARNSEFTRCARMNPEIPAIIAGTSPKFVGPATSSSQVGGATVIDQQLYGSTSTRGNPLASP
jgi:hypothetical protein